ncbi:glycosyltransferase family 4 protein [Herbiconiux sp. P16]|uniref:glycosyltransferase family 4 protein n=1 Tax=Herbiconiux wuyangfengii TaxID=3342794 RepID=UPI0035B88C4F
MKILYDGYWWTQGPASNREVMREIAFSWLRQFQDEITIFGREGDQAVIRQEVLNRVNRNVDVITSRVRPHGIAVLSSMQRQARRGAYDAIFSQNFSVSHSRSTVFLHDVLFETNPEWFTKAERAYFGLMTRTIGRATAVFTSSSSESVRIANNTRARRVLEVGLGPRQSMMDASSEVPPIPINVEQFVLCVGRFNVRKNLPRAIKGALESGRIGANFPLVIVGDNFPNAGSGDPTIDAALENGSLIAPGFVTDDQLRWLYENCAVFLMASLDEGFGMPVAEAATFGRPVVASNIPVFREIVQDAYFADPNSVPDLGATIKEAIDQRRPARVRRPISWDQVAAEIRDEISNL